jgi:hypothetical protein
MADQFVPTAWDNAKVTEGVFISRKAKGGYYYTRLEWHKWDGLTYTVRNELYRAEMQKGTTPGTDQDILGVRWPLADVYPYLDEETIIPVGESLFSYFRTPIANNLDDNSPLGVSMYGNALETLHALDICYDSFVSEFRLGKKRIIVPAQAVDTIVDPQSGRVRRYFNTNNEVYEALSTNSPEELKISDNSVELRVEEHVAAINAFLSILCLQVGFSAGTFTFDQHNGLKTATEVISENSKTYKTIKTVQNMLRPALEHMVGNIIDVAGLYDVQFEGQSVKALAEPQNYEARANLMWAGTVAHTNICGAGRIQDWASHGIEHELSALYDCAHGAGLAVVMPAWMEYVMEADMPRFARFASKVFGVAEGDTAAMAKEGILRYRKWLKSLDMPLTFAELGAKEEDIPALVAKLGLNGNTLGGLVQLNDEDVANIFRLAAQSREA